MAYDVYLGERISTYLLGKHVPFQAKKMMGGLVFMVNEKMCCGIHLDKNTQQSLLMARVGEDAYTSHVERHECLPMDFTGRPMKGFLFIKPEGFDAEQDLAYWLERCLDFNPKARQSRRR